MSLVNILNFRTEPRTDNSHHLFKMFHINDSPGNQNKKKTNEKLISNGISNSFECIEPQNRSIEHTNTFATGITDLTLLHLMNKPFLINAV